MLFVAHVIGDALGGGGGDAGILFGHFTSSPPLRHSVASQGMSLNMI
jgi:hypothetical protein